MKAYCRALGRVSKTFTCLRTRGSTSHTYSSESPAAGRDAIASPPNNILQNPQEENLMPGMGSPGKLWAAKEHLAQAVSCSTWFKAQQQPLSPAHLEHTCSSDHSTQDVFARDLLLHVVMSSWQEITIRLLSALHTLQIKQTQSLKA